MYCCLWVGELLRRFVDVAFLPSKASFMQHFFEILVEVKVSIPPFVLEVCLWLWVSKGMLPVKRLRSNKSSLLCRLNFMEII